MIKHSIKNRTKASKNTENAPIYVEITFNSQRARYYPGFNIALSQWDKDSQSVIRKRNGKLYVNASGQTADIINQYLVRVRVAVDRIFERYEYENKTPHPQSLLDDIRVELDDKKKDMEQRKDIFAYYDQFFKARRDVRAQSSMKNYTTRLNLLKEYGKFRYFEDFTKINLDQFVNYMITEKKFNNTYILKNLQDIKVFLKWAGENGFNKFTEYEHYVPKMRGFKPSRTANVFALTSEELMRLYHMDIKQDYLRRVRDVFCFSAFTSLRYSDVHALKWTNIYDDAIHIVMQKTTAPVIIPLNDYTRAIIERYKPFRGIFKDDHVLPVVSNQKTNKYLKELGKLAKIDRNVIHYSWIGNKQIVETLPAHELMSTHVGRKTFVSIMAEQGVPDYVIREFTGHQDARAMQPYMKIQDKAKSQAMSKMNAIATNESVFDYDITDDERAEMGIPERDQYETIIGKDKTIGLLHLAILMQKRGNAVKSLEYVTKLPDEMKVQYMQTITNDK